MLVEWIEMKVSHLVQHWLRSLKGTVIGAGILLTGVVVIAVGHLSTRGWTFEGLLGDLYANVGVDFIGIALVILIVDRLGAWREEDRLKFQLAREMGSSDHGLVSRAVLEMAARGWLYDGTMSDASLAGADLRSMRMDRAQLLRASFAGADLGGVSLSRANLQGSNLTGAKLRDANLEMADLTNVNLQDADLERTDMAFSLLIRANMAGAVLRRADLSNADLTDADLRNADVTDCRFDGAKLDGVLWDGVRGRGV